MQPNLTARFWAKVDKRSADECWLWLASTRKGYGWLTLGARGAGSVLAHRLSYEIHHGPIPGGLHVLHSCDNPPCVNPAHLSAGTQTENMRGASARGRIVIPGLRGEEMSFSKLTEASVRLMRTEYAAGGISLARLGAKFGVSKRTALDVVSRRTWAHVDA